MQGQNLDAALVNLPLQVVDMLLQRLCSPKLLRVPLNQCFSRTPKQILGQTAHLEQHMA